MALDTFMALLLFAFVSSITPGPNNMMLLASGANFGFRRTVPHMFGVNTGFLVLLLAVGFGLGALLRAAPILYSVLKFSGGAYLLWIAWKIGSSRSLSEGTTGASPMTFLQAAAFQWVNPKAWVMAITAMATYASTANYIPSVLLICGAFAAVNVPTVTSWAVFGSVLRRWLAEPGRLRVFNVSMAILLVLSLWPLLK